MPAFNASDWAYTGEQPKNLFRNDEWFLYTIPQRSIIYIGSIKEQQEANEQQEAEQMDNFNVIARPSTYAVFIKFSSDCDPGMPCGLAMALATSIVGDDLEVVSTEELPPYENLRNAHVILTQVQRR